VPVEDERDAFLAEAADAAADAVKGGAREPDKLRDQVRLAVRRVAVKWTGKKPVVDILLIDA
jgi:ribonuclease J